MEEASHSNILILMGDLSLYPRRSVEGICPDTGDGEAGEGRCSAGPHTLKPGEIAGQGESWEQLMLHTPWGDEVQGHKRKYGK